MTSGYSFHIGLNSVDPAHYDGWSGPLAACEADAASMEAICRRAGFQTSTLLTADATRSEVLRRLNAAANNLRPGDILVLSYAGHGGQIPDLNGDEDDSLDETWCLFDGELLDDELYRCWAAFAPGVRIAVFSDSCHSGSVVRRLARAGLVRTADDQICVTAAGEEGQPRLMPPDVQRRTYVANRAMYDALLTQPAPPPTPRSSVILVSGCQDNQLSMDGAFNGAFTGALLATWRDGAFRGSYADFTKAIRRRLPNTQSPNYMFVGKSHPSFESEQVLTI